MKRASRNAISIQKLSKAERTLRKPVCPKCGAGPLEKCFRTSSGGGYPVTLKHDHRERQRAEP